jgi:hypothetical protein
MLVTFEKFRPGTQIYNQIPGLIFPTYPQIIRPSQGRGARRAALSNAHRDEETNPSPLVVEFVVPQTYVRLDAGVDHVSSDIHAILRAFDSSGTLVDERESNIPPGPTDIRTEMSVEAATPVINRVELHFSDGYAEVIDNLEFPIDGPEAPAAQQTLMVDFVTPSDGTTVTGDAALLEIYLWEGRRTWRPRSVEYQISNDLGRRTGNLSFHAGDAGAYIVGPVMFGPLQLGTNVLHVSAEDFDGNVGEATISVQRLPVEGHLVTNVPRAVTPRAVATSIGVELQETFPGSLAGRDEILVEAFNDNGKWGTGRIRNPLSQPTPRLDLSLIPPYAESLGKAILTVRATEVSSGRILDEIPFPVSVTPSLPIVCEGNVPFYVGIPEILVKALINNRANQVIGMISGVKAKDSPQFSYGYGTLHFSQSYEVSRSLGRIILGSDLNIGLKLLAATVLSPVLGVDMSGRIDLYAELRPRISDHQFVFEYAIYAPSAEPGSPLTGLRFIPGINLITGASWSSLAGALESKFTDLFKDRFLQEVTETVNRIVMNTGTFFGKTIRSEYLMDVSVTPSEMYVAYCLPADEFDGL